jgi:hypothetical protein
MLETSRILAGKTGKVKKYSASEFVSASTNQTEMRNRIGVSISITK